MSPVANGDETSSMSPLRLFETSADCMGARFVISGYADSEDVFREAAESAFQRVEKLNRCFSDYLPASESNRLTKEDSGAYEKHVSISSDLHRVLIFAKQIHARSDGAVDITIGPITRLWRRARRRKEVPTEEQLADAADHVGLDAVLLSPREKQDVNHPQKATVMLLRKGLRFDFGAMAKGYAADEALWRMQRAGVAACLVDAGGDLAIGAPPPQKEGWTIRVAPQGVGQREVACLLLSHCGVATSGPAARGVRVGALMYSHIANPKNGRGLTDNASVTTIAPTSMEADGLATAISVLGAARGLALMDASELVEGCFVSAHGEPKLMKVQKSAGFDNLRTCQPATKPKNDASRVVRDPDEAGIGTAN